MKKDHLSDLKRDTFMSLFINMLKSALCNNAKLKVLLYCVLIIFCCALKKYTYFDVVTKMHST